MKLPAQLQTRKATMTLVVLAAVLLVVAAVPFSTAIATNLPTILGALLGVLSVFLTGHAFDQKWTVSQTQATTKTVKPEDDPDQGC